jgi:hypothetical protein
MEVANEKGWGHGGGGGGWLKLDPVLVSDCGDGYTFIFKFYFSIWPPSQKNKFPFPQLIRNVQKIRMQGAANISLLFITHLYVSATNHLAPMYQCCTVHTYKKFHGIYYDTLLVLQTLLPVTY